MKRLLSAVMVLFTFAVLAHSEDWADDQGSAYQKGDINLSFGPSLSPFGVFGIYEYGFHEAISGGGGTGFNVYSSGNWNYYQIPFIVRAGFHPFNLKVLADKIPVRDKVDVYAGFSVGWVTGWENWDGVGAQDEDMISDPFLNQFIGVRYYVSPDFYLTAEEQPGLGWFTIGVGFKF